MSRTKQKGIKIQFEISERDYAILETDLLVSQTDPNFKIKSVDELCKRFIHNYAKFRSEKQKQAFKEVTA